MHLYLESPTQSTMWVCVWRRNYPIQLKTCFSTRYLLSGVCASRSRTRTANHNGCGGRRGWRFLTHHVQHCQWQSPGIFVCPRFQRHALPQQGASQFSCHRMAPEIARVRSRKAQASLYYLLSGQGELMAAFHLWHMVGCHTPRLLFSPFKQIILSRILPFLFSPTNIWRGEM